MCTITYNGKKEEFSDIRFVVLREKLRILGRHYALLCEIPTKNGKDLQRKIEHFASFLDTIELENFIRAKKQIPGLKI